jgi:hypothetical protein
MMRRVMRCEEEYGTITTTMVGVRIKHSKALKRTI